MRHNKEDGMAPQWVWHLQEEGPAPMALGERIRQLRKEAGWSQAELGEKVGTDSQRISRYETGKITPSLDAIVRIAEAFNVSIDHLLVDDIPRRLIRPPAGFPVLPQRIDVINLIRRILAKVHTGRVVPQNLPAGRTGHPAIRRPAERRNFIASSAGRVFCGKE